MGARHLPPLPQEGVGGALLDGRAFLRHMRLQYYGFMLYDDWLIDYDLMDSLIPLTTFEFRPSSLTDGWNWLMIRFSGDDNCGRGWTTVTYNDNGEVHAKTSCDTPP